MAYGFIGRDLDVLRIERRLLRHNVLLIRGMGGAGKTTLLRHLAEWWTTTGLVERVFYFGYDERAWTRQQMLHDLAHKVLDRAGFDAFLPLSVDAQQKMLAEKLRARRHLLILDNLESVRGEARPGDCQQLPPAEREALRNLLVALGGGKRWSCSAPVVPGLADRGRASGLLIGAAERTGSLRRSANLRSRWVGPRGRPTLSQCVLIRHKATHIAARRLCQPAGLAGRLSLALEVVLANSARQTPAQVLAALQAGPAALDIGLPPTKTDSLLRCIEYSPAIWSRGARLAGPPCPLLAVFNTGRLGEL